MSSVLETREPSARYLDALQPALVRQFRLLATAPGGVARLRELILTLAVQGKLVPQFGPDRIEHATVHNNKELGVGSKGTERLPAQSDGEDSLPALPSGWSLLPLGDLVDVLDSRRKPVKKEDRLPGPYPYYGASGVVDYVAAYIFDEPLVLVGEDGAKWGAGESTAFMIDGKSWVNNHAHVLRPDRSELVDAYLVIALTAVDLSTYVTGMTVPKLNQSRLVSIPIPTPTLGEQARIVARVDELMRLCDALEVQGRLEAEQHARLLGTLLGTLTDSSTPEELAANWQRVADHFDLLLDRPEAVDALEQTILQLAVRGLLVPQDPSDQPAEALMHAIDETRSQLIAVERLKTGKPVTAVDAEDELFQLPVGWAWTRIDRLATVQGGIQKTPLRRPVLNHAPYLRVANVQRDALDLKEIERFEVSPEELERWRLRSGDLLIVEGNGSEHEIGRCAVWAGNIDPCVYQNHLIRVRCLHLGLVPFIQLFLNSPDGKAEMKRLAITTSGLFNLSVGKIRHYAVPVPPLAEQARIVARVTEIRRLCADLRQRLAASQTTQSHLAQNLVDSATA